MKAQCDEEHYQEKQSQNIRGPEAVASGCFGLRAGQEERIAGNRVAAEEIGGSQEQNRIRR